MNLNELQGRILAPFAAETIRSLKQLAQIEANAGDGFEDEVAQFRFKGYDGKAVIRSLLERL